MLHNKLIPVYLFPEYLTKGSKKLMSDICQWKSKEVNKLSSQINCEINKEHI